MEKSIVEGEIAILEMIQEIDDIVINKKEYLESEDLSLALLMHAISFVYESTENESEASHLIINIAGRLLQGEDNILPSQEDLANDHTKH